MGCGSCGHRYTPAAKPARQTSIPVTVTVTNTVRGGYRIPAPVAPVESSQKPVPPPEPIKNG